MMTPGTIIGIQKTILMLYLAVNAAGHLPERQEAEMVLTDAMHFEDAPKRRSLFVQLTLETFPTLHILTSHQILKRSLMEDFILRITPWEHERQ